MSWTITPQQRVNWTPALATTSLWLDAADTSTITIVSGAVSQWNDKSGNAKNATQSNSSLRPAIGTILNNRQTLDFAPAKGMSYPSLSARSVFAVVKLSNFDVLNPLIGVTEGLTIRLNSSTVYRNLTGGNQDDFTTPSGSIFRINGTVGATGTLTNWHFISAARSTTAASFNFIAGPDYARYWNGSIAEAVIFSELLGTFEIERMEGYLAHKWGLTSELPSGHPYKTNPPAP